MKNTKYFIALAAILIASVANATVRTLNNNNPTPGQYASWNAVQTASSIGDTIYVSGSPINYGTITITKSNLTIIGTGHNPQKQNPLTSKFNYISNTTVGQLTLDGLEISGSINFSPSFGSAVLTVNNSFIYQFSLSTVGFDCSLYLQNNVVRFPINVQINDPSHQARLTGHVRNNIIQSYFSFQYTDGNDLHLNNFIFSNNLFIARMADINGDYNVFTYPVIMESSMFINNILLGHDNLFTLALSTTNYTISNNISYPNTIQVNGVGSGFMNVNPLFENVPCIGTPTNCYFNYSFDYRLSSSSPGHNAGNDGTDIGPYGGAYGGTFTIYGEPHIPQMKQMNMPATVVSGSTFTVNIISTVK